MNGGLCRCKAWVIFIIFCLNGATYKFKAFKIKALYIFFMHVINKGKKGLVVMMNTMLSSE